MGNAGDAVAATSGRIHVGVGVDRKNRHVILRCLLRGEATFSIRAWPEVVSEGGPATWRPAKRLVGHGLASGRHCHGEYLKQWWDARQNEDCKGEHVWRQGGKDGRQNAGVESLNAQWECNL
uniref:Uncharacterized protein n=1 Tax=Prymnesium polylepis TaxID=72548 RepID=A0A6V4VRV3_9EUKA